MVKFYDSFESNKASSGFHDSLAEPSSTSWLGPNATQSDGLLRTGSTSRHEHNTVASRVRFRIVAFFITSATAIASVLYLRNNNRVLRTGSDVGTVVLDTHLGQIDTLSPSGSHGGRGEFEPVDSHATVHTKKLMASLREIADSDGVGFGHHYDNYYGQNFWAPSERYYSDVYNVTGSYPMVFGYDFYQYLNGDDWTSHAKWAHDHAGGAITVSWWAENPLNDESAANCHGSPIREILPGGSGNHKWNIWLEEICVWLNNFTDKKGILIPVVLRLFREPNENYWWWGKRCATAEQYQEAFNYTYDYISSRSHNVLWCYSPCKPSNNEENAFSLWYPGDDMVDIVAIDRYAHSVGELARDMKEDCRVLVEFTRRRHKIAAFGEFGIYNGIQDIDDMHFFQKTITDDLASCMSNLSYVSMWANYSPQKYWVPVQYEKTAASFLKYSEHEGSIFADDSRWKSTPYCNE
uniref:GH26 domain-containing protein n=1 Tax=Octactis speculum TaxID=3111310 RepID=A0A7S2CK11_9STRA|mmetsp:Transcript_36176/g.48958  ORF Transcript_36176/g.48958 Transcript_36176/m.48958 type:complete len:465 (+) Transcript_36176:35-1429(+)|eukprot:CAMPEP_0185756236 /NCGR_PEP_ID=MMETSP1174-20130828/14661_1 /TAXON_ID=35687 /ORGANISM="Dictyocha speculum, Strain CCMP1381" /LENGTH=464 /DNA_ID=CAMNT_0028435107 /DNA_START=35 /DNA_END=1429 /DNA_ORIENTATION=+